MKKMHRWFMGMALAGIAAVGWAPVAAQASPALAAGPTVYVDDDTAQCPGPNSYTSLSGAVTALGSAKTNVTIVWCAGTYAASPNNTALFSGFTGLTITGKGGPLINASGFGGKVLEFDNSSKVTVSGLYINGGNGLSASANATALDFENSSGTVKGVLINGWHQDFYSLPLTHVDDGIDVTAIGLDQAVTVTGSTIYDVQNSGIAAFGSVKMTVTKNHITLHSDIDVPAVYNGEVAQAGVALVEVKAGSAVSGNVMESNAGMEPYPCAGICLLASPTSRGVMLLQSSGIKVTGNRISHMMSGVSAESWCFDDGSAPSETHADKNVITGNKLFDNMAGVYIRSDNMYATSCVTIADHNVVKGNSINAEVADSTVAVVLAAHVTNGLTATTISGNKMTGYLATPQNRFIFVIGTGSSGTIDTGNTKTLMPVVGAQ